MFGPMLMVKFFDLMIKTPGFMLIGQKNVVTTRYAPKISLHKTIHFMSKLNLIEKIEKITFFFCESNCVFSPFHVAMVLKTVKGVYFAFACFISSWLGSCFIMLPSYLLGIFVPHVYRSYVQFMMGTWLLFPPSIYEVIV